MRSSPEPSLSDEDYENLAELRRSLRAFLHWSADQAQRAGLTPTQHQLLLAVRASRELRGPTVGDIASILLIRHHSAVGLVDRAQEAGLIDRVRDPDQHSIVRLRLTAAGSQKLESLSELHLRELRHLASTIRDLRLATQDAPAEIESPT